MLSLFQGSTFVTLSDLLQTKGELRKKIRQGLITRRDDKIDGVEKMWGILNEMKKITGKLHFKNFFRYTRTVVIICYWNL